MLIRIILIDPLAAPPKKNIYKEVHADGNRPVNVTGVCRLTPRNGVNNSPKSQPARWASSEYRPSPLGRSFLGL